MIGRGVILLTIIGAACTSRTGPAQARTRLRITDTGPKDIKSLPFLMTLDELRQQGFDVEVVSVQSFDLVPDVLLHGDGEIGRISTQAAWTANAKGASLRTIVEANGTWEVVTQQRVRDEASARLSLDAGVVQTLAETYRSRGLWEANGGLTSARIQTSIDFLTAARALPLGLTPDRVVDLSYLNAVLDEIGLR